MPRLAQWLREEATERLQILHLGARVAQLCCNYFIQACMTVKVEIIGSTQKVHGEDQPHQSEIMIAVEVRNEDMIDPVHVCLIAHELHLRTFSAINKEIPVLYLYQLG